MVLVMLEKSGVEGDSDDDVLMKTATTVKTILLPEGKTEGRTDI